MDGRLEGVAEPELDLREAVSAAIGDRTPV
jgi:hypothetical protein